MAKSCKVKDEFGKLPDRAGAANRTSETTSAHCGQDMCLDSNDTTIEVENNQVQYATLDDIPGHITPAQFIKSEQIRINGTASKRRNEQNTDSGTANNLMLDRMHKQIVAASELHCDDILVLRPLLSLDYAAVDSKKPHSTFFDHILPDLLRLMRSNFSCCITLTNHVLDAHNDEVPPPMKEDLLCAVANILSHASLDVRDQKDIENQTIDYEETKYEEIPKPQPLAKLSASALSVFVGHIFSSNLYEPAENSLDHFSIELRRTHGIDLHLTYIPFLQDLIGLMLIYGIPWTNAAYVGYFESSLQQYFERFVGQKPTQQNNTEYEAWEQRACAARSLLESFDHSYFREILGQRYDVVVLPAMMELRNIPPATECLRTHERTALWVAESLSCSRLTK
ncbi:hypothetical protein N0V94_002820 [Neodidymelliopsis sp. IMI 364377]|nr:hypothetical protein N0V94_002820 [Neodidymelliopsis sp. IMI 364377]